MTENNKDIKQWVEQLNNTKKCLFAFNHVEINNNGDYRVCCRSPVLTNRSKYSNVEEYWNGEEMTSLRKDMLANRENKICSGCYSKENSGKISFRQQINSWLPYDIPFYNILESLNVDNETGISSINNLRSIDIRISNLCNLTCKMCNPYFSTRWAADWKYIRKDDRYDSYLKNPLSRLNDDELKSIFKIMSPNLKRITMSGGEPLIEPKSMEILDYLQPYAKNIHLNIVTNGSKIKYLENLNEKLAKFRSVILLLSADGYKDYYDYIRFPAKWNEFENFSNTIINFDNPNVTIKFKVLIQIYNFPIIKDTITYLIDNFNKRLDVNFLEYPRIISLYNLPLDLRKKLYNDWNQWILEVKDPNSEYSRWSDDKRHNVINEMTRNINLLNLDYYVNDLQSFIEFSDNLDKIQNSQKTWRELLPTLVEYIENKN